MAFSGGVYSRLYDWTTDRDNNIKILADRMDGEDDGYATGLSTCMLKDGTQLLTANIPYGTFKNTGMGAGSALTDSLTLGQAQNGAMNYVASDTGAADAYEIAPSPAISAYAAGQTFRFVAANASTGASTVDVSGLGTKDIQLNGNALVGAEIGAGDVVVVTYDGTQFQITSHVATDGDLLAANNLSDVANAATSLANIGGETADAAILKADTPDNLTAGFSTTVYDNGTQTSGTLTPDQDNGNMQKAVNGGAHTLAPPADDCTMTIQYTNDASAGAITTSGFTLVDGDDLTTTDGDDFFFYITNSDTFSLLTVKALQ